MPGPSKAEFNAFRQWYEGLGWAGKHGVKSGLFTDIDRPELNDIGKYQNTPEYQQWKQLGGGVGITPEVEAKAALYQTYLDQGGTPGKEGFEKWKASGKVDTKPPSDITTMKVPVRYERELKGGYWWLVGYDSEGNAVDFQQLNPERKEEDQRDYVAEGLEASRRAEWERYRSLGGELTYMNWIADGMPQPSGVVGGISPYEQERLALERERLTEEQRQFGREEELSQQKLGWEREQQQAMLGWYREQQQAQLEAERQQRLATLKAQPASWLEYAALSGEPPVVQPWMMPLGSERFGFQVGQEIPGWAGENAQGLPQLTRPGGQYYASLAPSQRQQYVGYERARTGATPEDVEWKLWSYAPPGGGGGGLRWMR